MAKIIHPQKIEETAILIDGGFYLKRARFLFGNKTPSERADELEDYCRRHINKKNCNRHLYRVFYYDCPPVNYTAWNPITQKSEALSKMPRFKWSKDFHEALKSKRKFALRFGELLQTQDGYSLRPQALKELMSGKRTVEQLTERDLKLEIKQKGVDMRIGVDVASLAYGGKVTQIIMIAGDSDFVPAAKLARRQGIDFILDPMWHRISSSLNEHIDGIESCCSKPQC